MERSMEEKEAKEIAKRVFKRGDVHAEIALK